MLETLCPLLAGLLGLLFVLWLFILLPAGMAKSRGRSALGWVTLLFSLILACLLLLMLGKSPNRQIND